MPCVGDRIVFRRLISNSLVEEIKGIVPYYGPLKKVLKNRIKESEFIRRLINSEELIKEKLEFSSKEELLKVEGQEEKNSSVGDGSCTHP